MTASSDPAKGENERDTLGSSASEASQDAHRSASDGHAGSARDQEREGKRVPGKKSRQPLSVLFASGDISSHAAMTIAPSAAAMRFPFLP